MMVIINFAHGISNMFFRLSEDKVDLLHRWIRGELNHNILEFTYDNDTYYLNREFVCNMKIIKDIG